MREMPIEDLDHFVDLDPANRILVAFRCPYCKKYLGKRADIIKDGDQIKCRCGKFSLIVKGEGFEILNEQIEKYKRLWHLV